MGKANGKRRPKGIKALELAVILLGSQEKVAKVVGVKQPSVNHMLLHSKRPINAAWGPKIERATKGRVKAVDLRPDVFGAFKRKHTQRGNTENNIRQ